MMHLLPVSLLATFASLAASASLQLDNSCTSSLWIVNATEKVKEPPAFELKSGLAYLQPILGKGNLLGVSFNQSYYHLDSPKFTLGTTQDQGRVWWSVNYVNGIAFPNGTFSVASGEPECGNTTTYDQFVHNCPDGDWKVTLDVCL